MAYLRLGNIKANKGSGGIAKGLSNCIRYIMNPAKTQEQKYIGGYNLIIPDRGKEQAAFDSMIATKKQFGKEDGRQGYHFKLSFASQDSITPEKAMELTYQFLEQCFHDYECVYAVHDNTAHLHSHIIINRIDMMEGLKYHYKKGDWAKLIQPKVNEICKNNNLSEIDLSMDEDFILKHKCNLYNKWSKEKGTRKKDVFYSNQMIKADVDACISLAKDYHEFVLLMQKMGHKVEDSGKHIKVLAPGRERYCRLYSLTPDRQTYTKENIIRMIEGTYMTKEEIQEKLMKEWNQYKPRGVKVVQIRYSLEFARNLEEVQMITVHNIMTKEDAKTYLDYLERADKELNVIRKKVAESLHERQVVIEKVEELMSLMKYYARYKQGDNRFYGEYQHVKKLYEEIAASGYHLAQLYRFKTTGELLIRNIDEYKKHLYVEKKICSRIMGNPEEIKQYRANQEKQERQEKQVRK